jgi:hypothetical protein
MRFMYYLSYKDSFSLVLRTSDTSWSLFNELHTLDYGVQRGALNDHVNEIPRTLLHDGNDYLAEPNGNTLLGVKRSRTNVGVLALGVHASYVSAVRTCSRTRYASLSIMPRDGAPIQLNCNIVIT